MKLFRKFLRHTCTHRFSWPRTDAEGRYYQICLACGTAFEYDWEAMRRTNRVIAQKTQQDSLLSHYGEIQ